MTSRQLFLACLLLFSAPLVPAQNTAGHAPDAELRFVVYISRHGVRSPTGKSAQYNVYSSTPWPKWQVEPGYLTPHGFHLMELFGAYDRARYVTDGLFHAQGCDDAAHVTIHADSDQRTRETGKALAQGMFPGCTVPTSFLDEGTNDPLFHFMQSYTGQPGSDLAASAIAGRLGGNADHLTRAYHAQIAALDTILATCGVPAPSAQRTSLFSVPAKLTAGTGDHLAEYKGPLSVASTLSENLLLEYAEGMEPATIGGGCVDGAKLRTLIDLHTAATDYTQRTSAIARAQASNLLEHILRALEQAKTQKPVAGAIARPTDRALFLVGHDTNLENISGLLHLNWIIDGRRDDTPPGSALVFELWKNRTSGEYEVRAYFTAQTLEQMRESKPLSLDSPPERVAVFIPACSRADLSCSWSAFATSISQAIDPHFVK